MLQTLGIAALVFLLLYLGVAVVLVRLKVRPPSRPRYMSLMAEETPDWVGVFLTTARCDLGPKALGRWAASRRRASNSTPT